VTRDLSLFLDGLTESLGWSWGLSASEKVSSVIFLKLTAKSRTNQPTRPTVRMAQRQQNLTAPEFVQHLSLLTLLSAEDIRLAKRNTSSTSLVSIYLLLALIIHIL
jgi:hypothetical protein